MNNATHQGGGFFNGFMWGLFVGGLAVFLLGTKKGRKLLKLISEEGLEGLAELEDAVDEKGATVLPNDTAREPQSIREEMPPMPQVIEQNIASTVSQITHFPKRFFRGIPKRGAN